MCRECGRRRTEGANFSSPTMWRGSERGALKVPGRVGRLLRVILLKDKNLNPEIAAWNEKCVWKPIGGDPSGVLVTSCRAGSKETGVLDVSWILSLVYRDEWKVSKMLKTLCEEDEVGAERLCRHQQILSNVRSSEMSWRRREIDQSVHWPQDCGGLSTG